MIGAPLAHRAWNHRRDLHNMRRVHAITSFAACCARQAALCKGRDGRDKTLLVDTPTRVKGEVKADVLS